MSQPYNPKPTALNPKVRNETLYLIQRVRHRTNELVGDLLITSAEFETVIDELNTAESLLKRGQLPKDFLK